MFFATALLIAAVSAQNAFNQILFPANNVVIQAGGGVQSLTWTNLTSGKVSVSLFSGTNPLREVTPIATDITNTGTFLWTPETWLPAANDYVIAIQDLSGSAPTQYSPYFTVQLCSTCSASTRSTTSSFSAQTVSVAGLAPRPSFTEAFPTPASSSEGAVATGDAATTSGMSGAGAGVTQTGTDMGASTNTVARSSGASGAATGTGSGMATMTMSGSAVSGGSASRTGSAAATGATSRAAAVANKENAAVALAAGLAVLLF